MSLKSNQPLHLFVRIYRWQYMYRQLMLLLLTSANPFQQVLPFTDNVGMAEDPESSEVITVKGTSVERLLVILAGLEAHERERSLLADMSVLEKFPLSLVKSHHCLHQTHSAHLKKFILQHAVAAFCAGSCHLHSPGPMQPAALFLVLHYQCG